MSLEICVEGVNASGKSTLIGLLSGYYNLGTWHPGPKPQLDQIAVNQCVEQYCMTNIIYDRLTCISRQVYGDVKENVNGLSRRHVELMNCFLQLMITKQVIFIHATGSGPHIIKDYYTPFHIEKITKNRDLLRSRYYEIFKRIPHMEYDFKINSFKEVIDYVKSRQTKFGYVSQCV